MRTNVLLVDDHPVFRKGLRLLVEEEDDLHITGEAGDGQAAIELVRELSPDIVLMDITMPELDGVETTQQILAEAPDTKVIALSIHSEKGFVQGMLLAGASGYILKESAPEEVVDGIRAVQGGEVYLSAKITGIVIEEFRRVFSQGGIPEDGAYISTPSILSTKLHRPTITKDFLPRLQLQERLNQHRGALTLITAPAGYGKSILASSWLQSSNLPSAWVSMDGETDDLRAFLSYLIAAIRAQFPDVSGDTIALPGIATMPPLNNIVSILLNDIEQIETEFILVLDDYHHIHETSIHNLVNELLQYPSPKMHLVIVSRGDPPLNLSLLRARGQINEIRLKDLRFSLEETSTFMNQVMGIHLGQAETVEIWEKTEGWVTALRLAALSLQQREDSAGLLGRLPSGSRYLQEYLMGEVLSHQPPDIQAWLLKTTILDRFCAPLCEAVCQEEAGVAASVLSGAEFIEWIRDAGLFTIALDAQDKWFRFHHLFQNILQDWLQRQYRPDEIAALHAYASAWLAENGQVEEAIQHALKSGDVIAAAETIERNRTIMLEADQWYILDHWLSLLPDGLKQQRPELLMAQAEVYASQQNLPALLTTLERLEQILDTDPSNDPLWGEVNYYRGYLCYFQGQGSQANEYQERAIELLPESNYFYRSEAELHYALSLHMTGNKDSAIETLNNWLSTKGNLNPIKSTRLWAGLYFIHLLEGDLPEVIYPAGQCLTIASKIKDVYVEGWALYMQACVHFFQNDQDLALQKLTWIAEHRYIMQTRITIDSLCGLALLYQMKGEPEKVTEAIDHMLAYTQEMSDPAIHLVASSCRARISLLQEDLTSALRWLGTSDLSADAGIMLWWLEVPRLTTCRVLIAEGSQENLQRAIEALQGYQQENQAVHNTYQQIVILTLLAMAYSKKGSNEKALATLGETLDLAIPGGWLLPFIELGPAMADLLRRLKKQTDASQLARETGALPYIDLILAAFPAPASSPITASRSGLTDPLTERELQVLQLLATALSTDEIASQLVVSVNTVRMHNKNIYSKLDAHSRMEAVENARDLGLI
jgi:LuxR family maltose regulon positive regulatory protein